MVSEGIAAREIEGWWMDNWLHASNRPPQMIIPSWQFPIRSRFNLIDTCVVHHSKAYKEKKVPNPSSHKTPLQISSESSLLASKWQYLPPKPSATATASEGSGGIIIARLWEMNFASDLSMMCQHENTQQWINQTKRDSLSNARKHWRP